MMAIEPITRQEQIIAGKDLEPITRMEKFLKEYGGGGMKLMFLTPAENAPEGVYTISEPSDEVWSNPQNYLVVFQNATSVSVLNGQALLHLIGYNSQYLFFGNYISGKQIMIVIDIDGYAMDESGDV